MGFCHTINDIVNFNPLFFCCQSPSYSFFPVSADLLLYAVPYSCFSAAFPALIRLSSSRNAISSTQCRLFPIPKCALTLSPFNSSVSHSFICNSFLLFFHRLSETTLQLFHKQTTDCIQHRKNHNAHICENRQIHICNSHSP